MRAVAGPPAGSGGEAHLELGLTALVNPYVIIGEAEGVPLHARSVGFLFQQPDCLHGPLDRALLACEILAPAIELLDLIGCFKYQGIAHQDSSHDEHR